MGTNHFLFQKGATQILRRTILVSQKKEKKIPPLSEPFKYSFDSNDRTKKKMISESTHLTILKEKQLANPILAIGSLAENTELN